MEELWTAVQPFLMAAQEALPPVPDQPQVAVPSPALHPNVDYDPLNQQIGGESLSQIYLQLICKYRGGGGFLRRIPSSKKLAPSLRVNGKYF